MVEIANERGCEAGLMTVRETADFLRLKESTIRDWVLRRKITYVKLGGRVFVRKTDAADFISKRVVPARPEPDSSCDMNPKEQRAKII